MAYTREPGYYWLRDKRRSALSIAKWDGEYWSFIGSVFLVTDDELDDPEASDAERIMERYEILCRIPELVEGA